MFYHAYDGYMTHAFPRDDLKPISCTGVSVQGFSKMNEEPHVMGCSGHRTKPKGFAIHHLARLRRPRKR